MSNYPSNYYGGSFDKYYFHGPYLSYKQPCGFQLHYPPKKLGRFYALIY